MMASGLTADDIYSINHSSLKDAVVLLGSGCTAEVVSDKGLLFTNHHCGFSYIQTHSSVEEDLISNGFWAMSALEELPNPGLSVTFLDHIENVTSKILSGTEASLTESARNEIISENIKLVKNAVEKETGLRAKVRAFYYGNEYYLFVYKIYKDVRLVGAPPSSIGNFGRDRDNWIWPRHTGDFCIFRIYAGKNNEPADYSPENVPFVPSYFFACVARWSRGG